MLVARRDRQSDDHGESAGELDLVRPYLDLAREIRAAVEKFATDDAAEVDSLAEALDAIPARERAAVARGVFDQLPPERQWTVLERLYGDDEIREHLADERAARLRALRRSTALHGLASAAREGRRLDLHDLPAGVELTLGLFLPGDVRAALDKGRDSHVCARRVVLRTTDEPGELQVIEDVFNPQRGLFMTAAYDDRVWQRERLGSHDLVRVGSLIEEGGTEVLQPTLYPGARVDLVLDGQQREGSLHLGFALLGEEDVFVPSR